MPNHPFGMKAPSKARLEVAIVVASTDREHHPDAPGADTEQNGIMSTADSELPASLGKVARRELTTYGITRFEQLADVTPAELLAIHGVGPKAVRILTEELAARGLAWRDDTTGRAGSS